jgi:hypothetical protein
LVKVAEGTSVAAASGGTRVFSGARPVPEQAVDRRKPSPKEGLGGYFLVMKWFLGILAGALIAAFAYMDMHSVKTTYVNGLPAYSALPGREFIVERECYVFKFKDHNTDWPLLGSNETVPDLPAEVNASHVGADVPVVRILDVVHVGDHFHIASVRRDVGRSGTRLTFEVLLADEASRKYPRLDTYWIMDHSAEKDGGAPSLLPAFAVPLRLK